MIELAVYLDGELCGSVEQAQGGNLTFRYNDEYRANADPTPLSLSMPLGVPMLMRRTTRSC